MGTKKTLTCPVFQNAVKNLSASPIRRAQLLELKYDILEGVQSGKFIDNTNNFSFGEFQSYASRK